MFSRSSLLGRKIFNNYLRKYHAHHGPAQMGESLPFPTGNQYKVTAAFLMFFVPPFWAPWLITRYQMLKK